MLFETEDKPFPFKTNNNDENNAAPEIVEGDAETVEDADADEVAESEEAASVEADSNKAEEEPK